MSEEAKPDCRHPLATRPILYTDTVNGEQTLRDDMWAVTTEELNGLVSRPAAEQQVAALKAEMESYRLIGYPEMSKALDRKNAELSALKDRLAKVTAALVQTDACHIGHYKYASCSCRHDAFLAIHDTPAPSAPEPCQDCVGPGVIVCVGCYSCAEHCSCAPSSSKPEPKL